MCPFGIALLPSFHNPPHAIMRFFCRPGRSAPNMAAPKFAPPICLPRMQLPDCEYEEVSANDYPHAVSTLP